MDCEDFAEPIAGELATWTLTELIILDFLVL